MTLPVFSDAVQLDGVAQAHFVRKVKNRPKGGGGNYYISLEASMLADAKMGAGHQNLDTTVAKWRRKAHHYEPLADGWKIVHHSARYAGTTEFGTSTWRHGGMAVMVNPHVALRRPDGGTDVIRWWFREDEPSTEAIQAMLYLMGDQMDTICPGGRAVVIDLRRHAVYDRLTASASRKVVAGWIAHEAEAVERLWTDAA
jgi:hypothetical protein